MQITNAPSHPLRKDGGREGGGRHVFVRLGSSIRVSSSKVAVAVVWRRS